MTLFCAAHEHRTHEHIQRRHRDNISKRQHICYACVVAVCRAKLPPVFLWVKTEIIIENKKSFRSHIRRFDASQILHAITDKWQSVHNLLVKWCWHFVQNIYIWVSAFAMVVSHRHASHRIAAKRRVRAIQMAQLLRAPRIPQRKQFNEAVLKERQQKLHPPPFLYSKKPIQNKKGWTAALLLVAVSMSSQYCVRLLFYILEFKLNARRIWLQCVCVCLNEKWMRYVKTRNFGCNAETRVLHFVP